MADISNFLLSWWYTPNTKLSIKFNTIGASLTSGSVIPTLDSRTGLSASLEENYHLENQITSHPVETGTNVSDHIIVMPQTITVTGILTAIDVLPIIGTGILNFNQLGTAVQFLFGAASERTLFTLSTGLYFGQSYFKKNNLAIQSIDIPRNNQYGRTSIKFTIVFKEVILTNTSPTTNSNYSTQGQPDSANGGVV